MGAYENPITVVDDKSALLLAQGFQSFSANLTKAFLEQQKKEKEIADQKRIDDASAVKAQVKGSEEAEKILKEKKEKFGDPADILVDLTRSDLIRERELLYNIESFTVRDDAGTTRQKEMQKEFNALKKANANINSDIESFDDTIKKIAAAQEKGFYAEGDLDENDPANEAIFKAYKMISTGSAKKPFTKKQNELGENILVFYPEEGEPFEWNITSNGAVNENKTVPNTVSATEAILISQEDSILQKTKSGYLPSDKYKMGSKDEAGNFMPEYSYKTEYKDGLKITYRAQKYNEEKLGQDITTAAQSKVIEIIDDPDKMRSVFLHNMKSLVGQKVLNKTITADTFGEYGEDMTDEQKELFSAAYTQYITDKYPAVPEYEEYAKVQIPKPTKDKDTVVMAGIEGVIGGKRKTFTKGSTRVRTADTQPEGESGWFELKDGRYALVENKTTLGWSADTGVTSEEALYDTFGIIDPELIVK